MRIELIFEVYKLIFNNEQIEKTLSDLKKYLNTQTNKPQNPDPFFIFLKENTITNEKLTLREIDILKYLNDGLNNKQIAEKLFISTNTVKYHVRNIYNKINVSNRLELKNVLSNITY